LNGVVAGKPFVAARILGERRVGEVITSTSK
jgi:hypothetical protein